MSSDSQPSDETVVCPECESGDTELVETPPIYECKDCGERFEGEVTGG